VVIQAARTVVDDLRDAVLRGESVDSAELSVERVAESAHDLALRLSSPSLRPAVNATGVILHTGLGRAPLPKAARDAIEEVASGHSTLEIDIDSGARGSRSVHYKRILSELCGAESAFAVNNNAAAVLLALNTFAAGREVIVSRGQLVEIGGSFRMPDIMTSAGARLVEVGTTNRTRISDYKRAVTDDTALILRVHPSNFRIVGFTQEATLEEMAELGRAYGIPVVDDAGSGALVDMSRFGLAREPTVQDSVRAGADIVTFSGDKLLGGPQAGLIVGRRDFLDRMAENPLSRALRLDKITLAGLEATLRLYLDPEAAVREVPTLLAIARPLPEIESAAQGLQQRIDALGISDLTVQVVDGTSEIGGGSLPGEQLPTRLLTITLASLGPNEIASAFRRNCPPIFGRVNDDRFHLDLRTVATEEIEEIVAAVARILPH
jgi:L-seryl-tRNA(Ser) seleniumtransferase